MARPIPTYRQRWPGYAKMWDQARIRSGWTTVVIKTSERLFRAKPRYQSVEARTGIPWWFIAPIHEREASQSWAANLAQGDPWAEKSVHVPKGRGPFKSWEDAAYDALVTLKRLDRVFGASPEAIRLEKVLYQWERYNGWGYYQYHPATPSPYLWGATTLQRPGKYVRDGVWSSSVMDSQIGCCAMLLGLMQLDPTINPQRED